MQYMGGKERQATYLVQEILKYKGSNTDYLEPFVGGGSIFSRVAPSFPGKALGSDVHPDLAALWSAAIEGWVPPSKVSREQYSELKNGASSALRGFVGFGCSFGGKWFGGFASNSRGDDFCGAAKRGVLRKVKGMQGQKVVCSDYRQFSPGVGTLVYCDPPYADTTGYSSGGFDSEEFWVFMQSWANQGAIVLVSEYSAPENVECVWSRPAKQSLRKDSNAVPAVEKLFLVRPSTSNVGETSVKLVKPSDPFTRPAPVTAPPAASKKGPWFGAQFPGECQGCLNRFEEGDQIRADGEGGYECREWCGQDDDFVDPTPCPEGCTHCKAMRAAFDEITDDSEHVPAAVPDPFTRPAPVAPPQDEQVIRGLYQVKDPETGDYRRRKNGNVHGYTRVTTFIKSASDSFALNQWGKRNIVIGMALEPQLAIRAAGLTHEANSGELDDLAEEASKLAGAKVAAKTGEEIHKLTERLDAGEITLDDIENPTYRIVVERYAQCLAENGFEPVPELIERTTMTKEYGGICGKFDRIYYHRPSGTYVIGDVKSGKTLKYGKNEIEAQLALYVMGFNAWGVYDWAAKEWDDGGERKWLPVRTDVGVVIHMPVQGDDAFKVSARVADLANGRRHVERCHDVRTQGGGDMKRWEGVLAEPAPARVDVTEFLAAPQAGPNWLLLFGSVRTREEAAGLYDIAVAAGVPDLELSGLVVAAGTVLGLTLSG